MTDQPANGWGEYKRLILDFMEEQRKHNERQEERLEELQASVTRLETQRSGLAWLVGPGIGAGVAALVMLALRKLGL